MGEFLKSVACSGTDCYSWILVMFNILAVFYLVFCSFWKVTRAAKITGWVWIAGLLCATVGILIAHTCIYTLLITIFTAMMIMAILAVILPQPNASSGSQAEEKQIKLGSYVISRTDDEGYVFAIHDAQKKLVVKSKYSYNTVDEAKREICVCRDNGMMAAISDKTGAWIREEYYPTFEIYARDGKYYFCLKINGEYVIFNSESYSDIKSCEKMLEKAKTMVASTEVYLNTVTVSARDYERFGESVIEEPALEEAVAEEPALEEAVAEESVTEEPVAEEPQPEAAEPCEQDAEPANEAVEEAAEEIVEEATEEATEEVIEETTEEAVEEVVEETVEETVEEATEEVTTETTEEATEEAADEAQETAIENVFEDNADDTEYAVNNTEAEDASFGAEESGIEVIGVMWPECNSADKIYRYDPDGETLERGDVVLVPSRDEAWDRDIVRAADVVLANYRIDSEQLKKPLKKIIRVISRRADKMPTAPELESADDAEEGVTGNVVFNAETKTLWDKYEELSEEQKKFFDKISEYASQKENVKRIKAKNYLTFKFMRDKLVRLRIRRDMVEAVFMLVGSSFKNAFSEGDVKVREAATIIRVENEAYLDVVLTTIDMEYKALIEERERRKEEQRAKRRKARKTALENAPESAEASIAIEAEAAQEAQEPQEALATV